MTDTRALTEDEQRAFEVAFREICPAAVYRRNSAQRSISEASFTAGLRYRDGAEPSEAEVEAAAWEICLGAFGGRRGTAKLAWCDNEMAPDYMRDARAALEAAKTGKLECESAPALMAQPGAWPTRLERDDVAETTAERFWRFVAKGDEQDCWLWTGGLQGDPGYGALWTGAGQVCAHRWSYEHFVGPIPAGLVVDHLCRVSACVNPRHLEAVTRRENTLRGIGPTAKCARKTHCKYGHPFDEANTHVWRGHRVCRQCGRESTKRREERQRLARKASP